MTEDLIAALSRFRTFAVVARNSSFAYKGRAVQGPEVAKALGVRYLLDGSLRREGRRLRVSTCLSDASDRVLWADCFEEELDGVFEVQDRITAEVVGHIEPQITRAELEQSRRKHPESMDAYDHFLVGSALSKRPEARPMRDEEGRPMGKIAALFKVSAKTNRRARPLWPLTC